MNNKHKNLSPVEKALLTWYKPDNDKYNDPLHPTMKLAGEVGELLDLYAKHLFKPGFNWMDCKHCGEPKKYHVAGFELSCVPYYNSGNETYYTPLVLDELGDIWYYLRILAWIYQLKKLDLELSINNWAMEYTDNYEIIKEMYRQANEFLQNEDTRGIQEIYFLLLDLLEKLGYTIDELTELNYIKLNSDDTNHGWANAL